MKIQRLRGMHDIFGEDALCFQRMEAAARAVFARFGFQELRTPILEEKELFSRALGTETDVVQKEMYEFADRSQTSVAMRPEGTAGVVRAYLENELDKKEGLCKFYYIGAMFRAERPQAGRLRQFHQIGVEQLGTDSPYADAETVHALASFLDEAGISGYKIKLNNLGTFEERDGFKKELVKYFTPKKDQLCEDCQARLTRNVFRLLDCKKEGCRAVARKSPPINDFLTEASKEHHKKVCVALTAAGVPFAEDPFMVRGLDYYTRTVFEITHPKLGAQDALAAGGRYDKLIESFGGKPAGAVGFAVGQERLSMCLEDGRTPKERVSAAANDRQRSVFVVTHGEEALLEGLKFVALLRKKKIAAEMDLSQRSFKSQMRYADKKQHLAVVILGEDELKNNMWSLKDMRGQSEQLTVPKNDIVGKIEELLKRG